MLDQEFHISELILGELNNTLSDVELLELKTWLDASQANLAFFNQFTDTAKLQQKLTAFRLTETDLVWEKIQTALSKSPDKTPLIRIKRLRTRVIISIAASVTAFILALGVWFWISKSNVKEQTIYVNDIVPGKPGATLTLSNGRKIKLSAEMNGLLAQEAGVQIRKSSEGNIIYELNGTSQASVSMNTLSTSKGETYQVHLPDGSLVWLNAASALTYPTSFKSAGRRQVKLIGEAYFEIAKDKTHRFIVETSKQWVEVLGTHFNISSYYDDPIVRTTLLEGRVKVYNQFSYNLLTPGEQSVTRGKTISVIPADVEEALDWKNGKIIFNDEPLSDIMKKISRWYDIEVSYRDGTDKFIYQGAVSRTKKISTVLNFFRDTETVDFIILGNKITVIKKN